MVSKLLNCAVTFVLTMRHHTTSVVVSLLFLFLFFSFDEFRLN